MCTKSDQAELDGRGFAYDTAVYVDTGASIETVIVDLDEFSRASDLRFNHGKSVFTRLGKDARSTISESRFPV